jgi:hypothetical protein
MNAAINPQASSRRWQRPVDSALAVIAVAVWLAGSALQVSCCEQRAMRVVKMGRSADAFHFLLGEWDIEMLVMPEGASAGRRAISNVHHILDGAALLDEIRHLDASGQVNFRGASFRTYVPDSDRWYVVWMMANVEGYSELHAEVVDGEIRTTGQGRDPGGELVERGRYYDISADGYSFTLDRSYDGGKTWIRPFVSYRAARRMAAR